MTQTTVPFERADPFTSKHAFHFESSRSCLLNSYGMAMWRTHRLPHRLVAECAGKVNRPDACRMRVVALRRGAHWLVDGAAARGGGCTLSRDRMASTRLRRA